MLLKCSKITETYFQHQGHFSSDQNVLDVVDILDVLDPREDQKSPHEYIVYFVSQGGGGGNICQYICTTHERGTHKQRYYTFSLLQKQTHLL